MARSDSSDGGRSRKHSKHSKKKSSKRSRSNSSNSDDDSCRGKHNRKHKKDERRRRSRSRERRSRSRERNKSRSRSREHKRTRSCSRSRSIERTRSRSYSNDRSYKARNEVKKSPEIELGTGWDAKPYLKTQDTHDSTKTTTEKIDERTLDKLTLKERIKLLTGQTTDSSEVLSKPTTEDIGRIEDENFVQESFSSTYTGYGYTPKQKKKKKKKQQMQLKQEKTEDESSLCTKKMEMISHESAIFGSTAETLHVSRFSTRLDSKRKEELRKIDKNDDLIFGAMFFDKPEVRMDRWITKLKTIRKLLLEDQGEEEGSA